MIAFLFPGQGRVDAKDLYELFKDTKEVMDKVEWFEKLVLKRDFLKEIEVNRDNVLTIQPLIVSIQLSLYLSICEATSYECIPDVVTGHSLGEFSSSAVAGVFSSEAATVLTAYRAELCNNIETDHYLYAVVSKSLSSNDALKILDKLGVKYRLALFNTSTEVVIAVDVNNLPTVNTPDIRLVPLSIKAFHTELMSDIADKLEKTAALSTPMYTESTIPVVLNSDGRKTRDLKTIRRAVLRQIANPVRWIDVMETLQRSNVTGVVEFPPGKRLSRFLSRSMPHVEYFTLEGKFTYDRLKDFILKHKA